MSRHRHTIDSKGRIFVPFKIRDDLGGRIYVTNSLDSECLSGYTPEQFDKIRQQLMAMSGTDKMVRILRREIIGEAIVCDVDSQGRISISEELWSNINAVYGSDVYIVYMFDKFEIWPAEVYDNQRRKASESIVEDLSRYDIKGI